MRIQAAAILAGLLLLLPTAAGAVDLQARLDRTRITLGESVGLTLDATGDPQPAEPQLPDLSGSFEIQGRGFQQDISVIDGVMESHSTHRFELTPLRAGTLTIPPIQVGHYHSLPLQLQVEPRPGATAAPAATGARSQAPTSSAAPPVLVEAELSRPNAYVRQKLVYSARFYRDPRLPEVELQLPPFPGFIVGESVKTENETDRDGRRYRVTEIQVPLYPTAAGAARIGPTEVVYAGRLIRDLKSRPVAVDVRPLPADGRPLDFSGAVGQFTVEARPLSATEVQVRVQGDHAPGWVPEPSLPGVKVLDRKVEDLPDGSAQFAYRLDLPAGETKLDGVGLAYFDPDSGQYRRATSPPVPLQGRRPRPNGRAQAAGPAELEEDFLGSPSIPGTPAVAAAVALPWLAVLVLVLSSSLGNRKRSVPSLHGASDPDELALRIRSHPAAARMEEALADLDALRFSGRPWTKDGLRQIADKASKGVRS